MAENEFEKKVQSLMQEFKVPPSDLVWERLEKEIRPQKRRRFILWIIPCLLFVAATGGYLLLQQKNSTIAQQLTENKIPGNNKPNIQTPSDTGIAETQQMAIAEQNIRSFQEKSIRDLTGTNTTNTLQHGDARKFSLQQNKEPLSQGDQILTGNKLQQPLLAEVITNDNTHKQDASNNGIVNNQAAQKNINKEESPVFQNSDNVQTENQIVKKVDTVKITATGSKGIAQEKQESKQKKFKLEPGVTAFYGRSDVVSSLLNVSGNDPLSQSLSNSNPGFYDTRNAPAPVKAGPSFSIGIAAKKDISKRSSIIASLNYSAQKIKITTGNKVDSSRLISNGNGQASIDGYYRSASDSTGMNAHNDLYQFIELPVTFNYRFNNSRKLPLYINSGLSIATMINSKALIYDRTTGIYYSDKSLYNKWQVNVLAGVSAKINLRNNYLLVGPQVQYSLSNLVKNKNYLGKQHLFNYGVTARFFFGKK